MLTALLANSGASYWMPEDASTVAPAVDNVFNFIYYLCLFFFVLVTVLLVLFVMRYRHRRGQERTATAGHSTALELTWTIIPTILVLVIFYFGFRGYLDMAVEPPNPYEINVTAQMWSWSFTYPNGHVDDTLHIPVNTPVRLVLSSKDVIHSLYVPAFRVKRDVVPGRYNRFWAQATRTGEFDLYCAEYCGVNHSTMLSKVVVHEHEDFKKWLEVASNIHGRMSPIEAGELLSKRFGCGQCHSVDGSIIKAPSFKDLFGNKVPLATGQTVEANEEYIRESIYFPLAKVHTGFQPVMPSFQGQLKEEDVGAIIAYLKSISTHYKGDLSQFKVIKGKGGAATQSSTTAPTTRQQSDAGARNAPATSPSTTRPANQ